MDPKALENMVGHVDPATMDKFTDADFERLIKKVALHGGSSFSMSQTNLLN